MKSVTKILFFTSLSILFLSFYLCFLFCPFQIHHIDSHYYVSRYTNPLQIESNHYIVANGQIEKVISNHHANHTIFTSSSSYAYNQIEGKIILQIP